MTSSLNVMIVGTGMAGIGLHLPSYRACPEVSVRAICDTNIELAEKTAREHGVPAFYSSIEEALKKENIQAVSICTPPKAHLETASTAMEHGCHVLVEKPMTSTLEEADKLLEVQKRTGRKLSVVHQFKCSPGVTKVMEMTERGDIGKITQLNMIWFRDGSADRMIANKDFWANALQGGRWAECIPHLFYIAYSLVGKMRLIDLTAKNVSGKWQWLPADEVQVTLESSTGYVTIRFSANMSQRTSEMNMLYGTKKTLYFDYKNVKSVPTPLISPELISEYLTTKADRIKQRIMRQMGIGHSVLGIGYHPFVIRRFVDHILYDRQPPTSFEEAYHTMYLTEEFGKLLESKRVK
jgi:predicted dehydrogenase